MHLIRVDQKDSNNCKNMTDLGLGNHAYTVSSFVQRFWIKLFAGWSTECLQGWDSYMKLAVPSAFMICFEWWVWEVGGFLAGMCFVLDICSIFLAGLVEFLKMVSLLE